METKSHDSKQRQITVVLYRPGQPGRTFQLPENWLLRVSTLLRNTTWITGTLSLLAVGSLLGSFLYVQKRLGIDPLGISRSASTEETLKQKDTMISNLERELEKLRTSLAPQGNVGQLLPGAQDLEATPVRKAGPIGGPFFSAFPISGPLAPKPMDPKLVPIKIEQVRTQFVQGKWKISFAILYHKDDGGSQQGHIFLLARGSGRLFTYPSSLLNPAGVPEDAPTLLNPTQGEFFSLSRYREVKAEFGPLEKPTDLQEVEVILLSTQKEVLKHDRILLGTKS